MSDEPHIIESDDDDTLSRPSAEQEREAAFNAGYSWKGVTFEGLTCSRKDLWTALCYKAGFPPLRAGFDDIGWFTPTAKALVWVCATPSKTLRRLHALGIDSVLEAFTEWADENVRIPEEGAIRDLAQRILIDSNANQSEATGGGGGGK